MTTKRLLRQQLKAHRAQLTQADVTEASSQASQHLLHSTVYQASQHVACYCAINNEISCATIIQRAFLDKKHVYLPVITDHHMCFVEYKEPDSLHQNGYGILEPKDNGINRKPQDIDLIVAPLVGFDAEGRRLGMGGGYYDSALQNKTHLYLCGLAYTFQEVKCIPNDDWDVRLDAVVTEQGMRCF
jgi:5-formyltetrahydrofolate cyclo-ligase